MQKMRCKHVLLVGGYAPSVLRFRRELILDILSAGHSVSVAVPDINQNLSQEIQALGVNLYETDLQRTGRGILADIRYKNRLSDLIKSISPDLVLTYTIKPNIWGAFAARKANVRSASMITGLGYYFTKSEFRFGKFFTASMIKILYRFSTSFNELVIFQNPDDRNDFINARCLSNESKSRIVNGSGVNMEYYSVSKLPEKPVFLLIARFLKNKGVQEYANAAIRLLKEFPDAEFHLLGYVDNGPDDIPEEKLREWEAAGIIMHGRKSDIRPAMADASVYVLPSYREGTPRSVLEAMAMGRPIITTNAPGCRETVDDGINGYLVPVADTDALYAKMKVLLIDKPLRSQMGNASFKKAKYKYEVHKVNSSLLSYLGLTHPII